VLVLSHSADWGTHLAAQADERRSCGSRVETILPDSSQNALGVGMFLKTDPLESTQRKKTEQRSICREQDENVSTK
jgi:hypothetical protein